jgi:hypothetical protein
MASSMVQLRRHNKTECGVFVTSTCHAKSCNELQESTAESGKELTRWRAFCSIVVGDSGNGGTGGVPCVCFGLGLSPFEDAVDDWE